MHTDLITNLHTYMHAGHAYMPSICVGDCGCVVYERRHDV